LDQQLISSSSQQGLLNRLISSFRTWLILFAHMQVHAYHNTIACATSIHLRLFKHITCLEGKSNSQWPPLPHCFSLPSFLPWPHGRPQPTTLALFKTFASLTWSRLVRTIYVLCVSLISVMFSCPHNISLIMYEGFLFCGLIMYEIVHTTCMVTVNNRKLFLLYTSISTI
jgi:hypothetical protein